MKRPSPGTGSSGRSGRLSQPRYSTNRKLLEREVVMDTFRARGPGGQHRNVTESAVRLRHPPSGLSVVAADSRSQHRNRETAFSRLIHRLERLNRVPKPRVATRVTRRAYEQRLTEKKHRQVAKGRRGRITGEE